MQQVAGDFHVTDVLGEVLKDMEQCPFGRRGGEDLDAGGAALHAVGEITIPDAFGGGDIHPGG